MEKKLVPRESNAKTVQGRSHKQGGDIEAMGSLLVISERERKGRLLRRSPNKPSVRQWNQGKCTVLGATESTGQERICLLCLPDCPEEAMAF